METVGPGWVMAVAIGINRLEGDRIARARPTIRDTASGGRLRDPGAWNVRRRRPLAESSPPKPRTVASAPFAGRAEAPHQRM